MKTVPRTVRPVHQGHSPPLLECVRQRQMKGERPLGVVAGVWQRLLYGFRGGSRVCWE